MQINRPMTHITPPQIFAKLIREYEFFSNIIIIVSIAIAKMFIKPKANIVSINGKQHLTQEKPYLVPDVGSTFWQHGIKSVKVINVLRSSKRADFCCDN